MHNVDERNSVATVFLIKMKLKMNTRNDGRQSMRGMVSSVEKLCSVERMQIFTRRCDDDDADGWQIAATSTKS